MKWRFAFDPDSCWPANDRASLNPRQNKLLAALPNVELLRLVPELDPVELHQGQALYESGTAMSYVYFPTTAVVSMVYEFEDGALAETAVVGNEGLVGIAVFMGGDSRLGRAVVLALRARVPNARTGAERRVSNGPAR